MGGVHRGREWGSGEGVPACSGGLRFHGRAQGELRS